MSDGVYIGLMSGTSLDGISAAVVRFTPSHPERSEASAPRVQFELLAFRSISYTKEQRERLLAAMTGVPAAEYSSLAFDFGGWLAEAAVGVIADAGVARKDIVAIGSHGQTLWHNAPHDTWQFGESAVIAERTGFDVISDFRVADVAAGGQGAPLVPIADAMLWSGDTHWRALQNIGGIGNVTVVPPGGTLEGVRAFDTGPGVGVIDAVVRQLDGSLPYDVDGKLAGAGTPVDSVVDELLGAPYFKAPPPKSTGRELFNAQYVTDLIAKSRAARKGATTADIVATATALTARSIADAYERFLPEPIEEVLLSGGGAKNPALTQMIEQLVKNVVVRRFGDVYVDGEAKEAIAFALLARLFLERRPGNVVAVTGARGPRVLGKLTPATASGNR
jgi:anhydro-N-acetylmuramic acid kinase